MEIILWNKPQILKSSTNKIEPKVWICNVSSIDYYRFTLKSDIIFGAKVV